MIINKDARYKNYLTTLNKWYKYNEKNEKASFDILTSKFNSTIFIRKRNINDVTPDCSSFITIDNLLLLGIIDTILNNYLTMQVNDFYKFNILTKKEKSLEKELKGELIFGKDAEGYYLAIKCNTISIKFLLTFSTYYSEVVVYNKSTQEGKDFLSKTFTGIYFNNLKTFLNNILFVNSTIELPTKDKPNQESETIEQNIDSNIVSDPLETKPKIEENTEETIVPEPKSEEVAFVDNEFDNSVTTLDSIKSTVDDEQLKDLDNFLSETI